MLGTSPSKWTVRTRSTVASAVVMTVCLTVAGAALLLVLFRTLEGAAQATAASRTTQLTEQLSTEAPAELDRTMLATDSQVGVVQVIDGQGTLVAQSAGSPDNPLVNQVVPPGHTASIGRVEAGGQRDLWVTAAGVNTPTGPVTVLVGADREPAEDVVWTVAVLLAVGGPLVIVLAAAGTYLLVGRALQPVERIRSRVATVTGGKLDERIPVSPAGDEISRLAITMNDMLDRLEAGQASQRRFISDASHELRSPLASITAALDLAHRRPDQLDRSLIDDSLRPEAQRMHTLVEDLLLLARADEHTDSGKDVDVDLDDIMFAEAGRIRSITDLTVITAVQASRVVGDPGSLSRLVRNLVDNAIRHAHSTIRLECAVAAGQITLSVSDDGPGIPASERVRVFDRFVRLDTPRDRQSGGSGLGLSIVKQIAEVHGGSVLVRDAPGGGACFEVLLPFTHHTRVDTDG